jgi:hypothetical protein
MKDCSAFDFSEHALVRIFNRGLTIQGVKSVISNGEIIAHYPTDKPYPSFLMLGYLAGEPLHVVVAQNEIDDNCIVITAYCPNPEIWNDDFKTKIR